MAGILDTLRTFFAPPPTLRPGLDDLPYGAVALVEERNAVDFSHDTGGYGRGNSAAGEQVDDETAFRSIAVQAAVRLLVNDIGSLPVDAFRKVDANVRQELAKPSWMMTPQPGNPNLTWEDHVKQVVFGVLTAGESFVTVFPSVFDPRELTVIEGDDVRDVRKDGGSVLYDVEGYRFPLTPANVLHIPWLIPTGEMRGLDPIRAAREGLGIALASDRFVGSYFGNGAVLSGVIEFPPGVDPTPDQLDRIKGDFKKKHEGARKSHAVGALTGGAKYVPFDYSNRDAQLLELRDQVVEEVARLFGIPPHMLGSQKPGAVGYASVEQRSIDYVTHAVMPIVRRIEAGYSRLLYGQKTYLKFNIEGLQRGDSQGRATYYSTLLQNKVIRREEVRAKEDLPYDPDGVGYLETPNNNAPDVTPTRLVEPLVATRSEDEVAPVVNVTANVNLPESFRIEALAPTVNVAPAPAPIVNVTTDTSEVAEAVTRAVTDLTDALERARAEERRAIDALAARELPAPVINVAAPAVTVKVPDEQKIHILTQPKVTKTTRVTSRDNSGRVVETVTEE